MTAVDQRANSSGAAVAAGRGEQAERLVAPGAAERIFGDRQKLEMREAHFDHIRHEPLAISVQVRLRICLDNAAARSPREPRKSISGASTLCRAGVSAIQASSDQANGPVEATIEAVPGDASLARATGSAFCASRAAVGTEDLVFVERARSNAGNEQLPNARLVAQAHRMSPAVPGVEVCRQRTRAARWAPRRRSVRPRTPPIVIAWAPRQRPSS